MAHTYGGFEFVNGEWVYYGPTERTIVDLNHFNKNIGLNRHELEICKKFIDKAE